MCKKPDESLIGQCDHDITQGVPLVSLSKGTYWQISNIVIKFVLTAFLYLDPCCLNPTVNVVLNWHLTCFSKYGRENQIGARIRSCILPTLAHWETLWQTEREPSEYIQTSAQVFLKHLEANFKNLDRMELMSDLTLQFFLSLNNDLFFFRSRRWLWDSVCTRNWIDWSDLHA